MRPRDIFRKHRRPKPVLSVIRLVNRILLRTEGLNDDKGTEYLLSDGTHLPRSVLEDRGWDKVALFRDRLVTEYQLSAFRFGRLHVAEDAVALSLRDLRAVSDRGVELRPDLAVFNRVLLKFLDEGIVDRLLDVYTGSGRAYLAHVAYICPSQLLFRSLLVAGFQGTHS